MKFVQALLEDQYEENYLHTMCEECVESRCDHRNVSMIAALYVGWLMMK